MKKLLTSVVIACFTLSVFARDPQRGYRGFVEMEANVASYTLDAVGSHNEWLFAGSTSHGYQFNPHLFVGAGLAIGGNNEYDRWLTPLFLQVRTDQHWGKFTPFGDFRLGYNCADGGGIYLSPTIGHRFNLGRKLNLNVGLGMTLRGYSIERYEIIYVDDAYGFKYLGKSHQSKANFTIRIGLDF